MGWTCPECGLDYDTVAPSDAVVAARSFPRRFGELLTSFDDGEDGDALVRRRPDAKTWSALEYTAHVRDVFGGLEEAVRRIVREDEPTIDFADPDEQAAQEHYNEQDPKAVLDGLRTNAERLATTIDGVAPSDWTRTGHFPWGDRDALTMARNAIHEGHHHLRDVEQVLAKVRGRAAP